MTERRHFRPGVALVFSLVLMGSAAIVIAGVVGYVGWSVRQSRAFLAKDRCRLIAQSAIEQAKVDIQNGFDDYIANNFASVRIAPNKAPAYNWFNTVGADHRTIGSPNPVTIFAGRSYPMDVEVPFRKDDNTLVKQMYKVWVGIGKAVDHPRDSSVAVIPVSATAVWEGPGMTVSATIQERVFFGTGQSRVFDNAYFVNNYGWMSGNFTINGEFRANGNVSLQGGAVVNGFIYAAPNREIGAAGRVTTLTQTTIYNQSNYRQKSTTRSRYDIGNLNEMGSYNPASVNGNISYPRFAADGVTVTSGTKTADGKPIINEYSNPVEMPFVSELAPYIQFARDNKGTLTYPESSYTDATGQRKGTPAGVVNAHYSGPGPSRDESLGDRGSLLLVGTSSNPIRIDGPVVIDGDVIIKGYVTGQGTIYAGRNVHIIGDIKYKNEPVWTHTKTGSSAESEQAANEKKDMLGIVAKGNIVIGDATSSSICNTISGVSEAYACDASDADIGYAARFDGDYSKVEATGSKLKVTSAKYVSGSHTETYRDAWGRTQRRTVTDYAYRTENATNRRYWQTACDDKAISDNLSTVSQIDAVMYNNHAVFGSMGAGFRINGALICRDEGLQANGGTFNWDMRLRRKKDSEVVEKMGLPVGAAEPFTEGWMEIPDSENPVYAAALSADAD